MMIKNFLIGQSNEVIKGDKIFDLHNSYDFVGIVLKGKECNLQIFFDPNLEYGKGNLPIILNFKAVDYLEFSPKFGTQAICDLDEIGYKNPDDQYDECLLDEQQSTNDDHLFIRLDGGAYIRVHSQLADIVEQKSGTEHNTC